MEAYDLNEMYEGGEPKKKESSVERFKRNQERLNKFAELYKAGIVDTRSPQDAGGVMDLAIVAGDEAYEQKKAQSSANKLKGLYPTSQGAANVTQGVMGDTVVVPVGQGADVLQNNASVNNAYDTIREQARESLNVELQKANDPRYGAVDDSNYTVNGDKQPLSYYDVAQMYGGDKEKIEKYYTDFNAYKSILSDKDNRGLIQEYASNLAKKSEDMNNAYKRVRQQEQNYNFGNKIIAQNAQSNNRLTFDPSQHKDVREWQDSVLAAGGMTPEQIEDYNNIKNLLTTGRAIITSGRELKKTNDELLSKKYGSSKLNPYTGEYEYVTNETSASKYLRKLNRDLEYYTNISPIGEGSAKEFFSRAAEPFRSGSVLLSIPDLWRASVAKDIIQKAERGEELSEDETAVLDTLIEITTQQQLRQNSSSSAGNIGEMIGEQLPFMLSIALGGAIYEKGAELIAKKMAQRYLQKMGMRLEGKALDDAVEQALKAYAKGATRAEAQAILRGVEGSTEVLGRESWGMLGRSIGREMLSGLPKATVVTALSPQTYADLIDRTGTQVVGKDDQGNYQFKESDDSVGRILWDNWKENYTEIGTPAMDKVMSKGLSDLGRRFFSQPNTRISKTLGLFFGRNPYMNRLGVGGLAQEGLEEYYGAVLDAVANAVEGKNPFDESWQQFFSRQGQAELWLSIAPMSVLGGASNVYAYGRTVRDSKNATQDLINFAIAHGMDKDVANSTFNDMPNMSLTDVRALREGTASKLGLDEEQTKEFDEKLGKALVAQTTLYAMDNSDNYEARRTTEIGMPAYTKMTVMGDNNDLFYVEVRDKLGDIVYGKSFTNEQEALNFQEQIDRSLVDKDSEQYQALVSQRDVIASNIDNLFSQVAHSDGSIIEADHQDKRGYVTESQDGVSIFKYLDRDENGDVVLKTIPVPSNDLTNKAYYDAQSSKWDFVDRATTESVRAFIESVTRAQEEMGIESSSQHTDESNSKIGDVVNIDGTEYTVTAKNDDGTFTLRDAEGNTITDTLQDVRSPKQETVPLNNKDVQFEADTTDGTFHEVNAGSIGEVNAKVSAFNRMNDGQGVLLSDGVYYVAQVEQLPNDQARVVLRPNNGTNQAEQPSVETTESQASTEDDLPRDKEGNIKINEITDPNLLLKAYMEICDNDIKAVRSILNNEVKQQVDKVAKAFSAYDSADTIDKKQKAKKALSKEEDKRQLLESTLALLPMEQPKGAEDTFTPTRVVEDKRDEADTRNIGNLSEKFANTPKVVGFTATRTLPNGEKVRGIYMLVEAGGVTPSHDVKRNFAQSKDFPTREDGSTLNDRDYEQDKNAQEQVMTRAGKYNGQAVNDMPIVDTNGIVLSGNDRTMSGELAAMNNTDTAYLESLRDNAQMFGFTEEQVNGMQHPRLVFVLEENMPYTTETFAKFNASEKKAQNNVEKAVKVGKTIKPKTLRIIADIINKYDTIAECWNDPQAVNAILNTLIADGQLQSNDIAQYTTSQGLLNDTGKEYIETVLLGSLLTEENVRNINEMPFIRQRVLSSLKQILDCNTLNSDYTLAKEINEAIGIVYTAHAKHGVKQGEPLNIVYNQLDMFSEKKLHTLTVKMIADVMNSNKVRQLKKVLSLYVEEATLASNGQSSLSFDSESTEGNVRSREDILIDILNQLGYEYRREQGQQSETRETNAEDNVSGVRNQGERHNGRAPGVDATRSEGDGNTRTAERKGITEDVVTEALKELGLEGQNVLVANNTSDLPPSQQEAKNAIFNGVPVRGWYDPKTDRVYLYAPNLRDKNEVKAVVLHELVSHKGLRALLGNRDFNRLCDKVWSTAMDSKQRKDFVGYVIRQGGNLTEKEYQDLLNTSVSNPDYFFKITRQAADEYIAHIAEQMTDIDELDKSLADEVREMWRKICELIRAALHIGKDVKIDNNALAVMIHASYQNLRNNTNIQSQENNNQGSLFSIKDVNEKFNEELQQQIDGTLSPGHIYQIGLPSDILCSTGFPCQPIEMSASHLTDKRLQGNHPFDIAEIKNLPQALQKPIAVFKYGDDKKAQNVIVELTHNNKNFLVGVHFNQERNGVEVSSIRGLFPKDNAEWLNWITQGKALYLDKEKIQTLISQQQINLADVAYLDLDNVAKVIKNFVNPPIQTPKNSTINDILFSINVNHNSPYLLKKADGSFVDPETGERLGFDHRFMGKGEGAQAHGWGSYFSVNDLRHYGYDEDKEGKKDLYIRYNGTWYNTSGNQNQGIRAAYDLIQREGTVARALKKAEYYLSQAERIGAQEGYELWKEVADFINNQGVKKSDFKTEWRNVPYDKHHYSVDIPDDNGENYLIENDRLSQGLADKISAAIADLQREKANNIPEYNPTEEELKEYGDMVAGQMNGRTAYEHFVRELGSMEAASKKLNEHGIVGVRYDGRIDGECYVIFDEDDAKIVDHVRFSIAENLSQRDKEYAEAVEAGDMEKAQEMVIEAAKIAMPNTKVVDKNGNPLVVYHGTQSSFNTFSRGSRQKNYGSRLSDGFYFSTKKSTAEYYSKHPQDGKQGEVKSVYLNIEKPLYVSDVVDYRNKLNELSIDYVGNNNYLRDKFSLLDDSEKLQQLGYDGVIELRDDGVEGEIVAINPNQIKSAAPATYDDNENLIPLSQRFNDNNNDIRFSLAGTQVVDLGNNTLVGLHNIGSDKLRKAIKQGGLANPSVAVIDLATQNHEGYGDISLVLPSDMIESSTGDNSGTFLGDAWTPTYPYVKKMLTEDGYKKIYDLAKQYSDGHREIEHGLYSSMEDYIREDRDRLHYLFLKTTGRNPEIVMNKPYHPQESYDKLKDLIDNDIVNKRQLTKEESDRIFDVIIDEKLDDKDISLAAKNFLMKEFKAKYLDEDGILYFSVWQSFIESLMSDNRKRENPTAHYSDTESNAHGTVIDNGLIQEYNNWKSKLFTDDDYKEYLFNGFTPSGTRRYLPNTIENASRIMNKESQANAYNNTGYGATKAVLLQKVKTLDAIRKNKGLLKNQEEVEAKVEEMSNRLYDIVNRLSNMQRISDNQFSNVDYANARFIEALGEKNPIRYLNTEYGYDIDQDSDFAKDLAQFVKDVKKAPVKYFETKFRRPVYLNEFVSAVVPNTIAQDIKDSLLQSGLKLYEYDKDNEGSRREATIQASNDEGIRFSIARETPRNTTLDEVLFSIKVNHNSPYLIKKANGSFVDPETGETLGFDHRFMGRGEGAQAHGWGSYFSVNDIREYGQSGSGNEVVYNGKAYDFTGSTEETDLLDYIGNSYINPNTHLKGKKDILDFLDSEMERAEKGNWSKSAIERIERMKFTAEKIGDNVEVTPKSRHHYSVDIPDDNGSNYINENGILSEDQIEMLKKQGDKERELGINGFIAYAEEKRETYPSKRFFSDLETKLTPREISEFLNRAGFTGVHYYGAIDGYCYVIFNENDAKIVDHVRFSIAPAAKEQRLLNDEEKVVAKQKLEHTKPIKAEVGVIKATDKMTARQAAKQWADAHLTKPFEYDTEAGVVVFDKTSVKNSLSHGYNQAKLDAIPTIKEGFEKATYLGSLDEFGGSDRNETVNHYFAYPIKYNGDLNYVFCRAKADANKNRLYVHEVFIADKIKSNTLQTAAGNESEPHGGIALYKNILSDVLNAKVQQNSETNTQSAKKNSIITPQEDKTYMDAEAEEEKILQKKLQSWLNEENLTWAKGKKLNEIIDEFGNKLEPIAIIPPILRKVFPSLKDNYLYSGKGYFIDHAINHHPELVKDEYNKIQIMLNNYDDIKNLSKSKDKVNKVAVVKRFKNGYAIVVELSKEDDKIVLHKTFFYDSKSKRLPFDKKESLLNKSSVDGNTTINPIENNSRQKPNLSTLDDSISSDGKGTIKNNTNTENEEKKSQESEKFFNDVMDALDVVESRERKGDDIRFSIHRNANRQLISDIRNRRARLTGSRNADQDILEALDKEIFRMNAGWRNYLRGVRERWIDQDTDLERFQQAVVALGGTITDESDAWNDINHSHSRAQRQIEKYEEDYFKPLVDTVLEVSNVVDDKLSIDARYRDKYDNIKSVKADKLQLVEYYLQALDIIEAEQMGIVARGAEGFKDVVGMEPQSYVKLFEDTVDDSALLDKLQADLKRSTDRILDLQVFYNLSTEDDLKEFRKRKHYIPQRGFAELDLAGNEVDTDMNGMRAKSTYNEALRKAEGRRSLAEKPIAYIMNIAQSTIFFGEKNKSKVAMLKMIWDNQSVNGVDIMKELGVTVHEKGRTIKNQNGTQQAEFDYRRGIPDNKNVEVVYYGTTYVMTFSNPKIARSLNRDFQSRFAETNIIRNTGGITRLMTNLMTSLNPAFAATNLVRDAGFLTIGNFIEGNTGNVNVKLATVQPTVAKYLTTGKIDTTTKYGKYLEEFLDEGGLTGFAFLMNPDEIQNKLKRLSNKSAITRGRKWDAFVESLRFLSELSEASVRFAQYAGMRDAGHSVFQSVTSAKNITTNFNRKGTTSRVLSPFFGFLNATLQGTDRFVALLNSKVGYGVAAAMVVGGFMASLLSPNDDDDEVYFSDYERMTNICIGNIKIPLAHGFRVFYGLGYQLYSAYENKDQRMYPWGQAMFESIMFAYGDLLPITPDPFKWEGSGISADPKMAFRGIMPTSLLPIYDVGLNVNFMGYRIHPESFDKNKPQFMQAKKGTPQMYIDLSKDLFRLGGGDPKRESIKNNKGHDIAFIFDVNPTSLQYLVEGYLSGWYKIPAQTMSAVENKDIKLAPVVNRFTKSYQPEKRLNSEAWSLNDIIEDYSVMYNSIEKAYKNAETPEERNKYYQQMMEWRDRKRLSDYYKGLFNKVKNQKYEEEEIDQLMKDIKEAKKDLISKSK